MQTFQDRDGRAWDIVVGRESWGSMFAIFVPKGGGSEIRQTLLDAESQDGAEREMNGLGRSEVQALLDRSQPKPMG